MAVGTNYTFDEASIGEDTVQDYLHACRCTDAAEARKPPSCMAAVEARHARATHLPGLRPPAHDRWATS